MTQHQLSVALDYTDLPGGRYPEEGPKSGQEFREEWLLPRFLAARAAGATLTVSLDGVEGYATSFLEEAFGGLVRALGLQDSQPPTAEIINRHLRIECFDVPLWAQDAHRYITKALRNNGALVAA